MSDRVEWVGRELQAVVHRAAFMLNEPTTASGAFVDKHDTFRNDETLPLAAIFRRGSEEREHAAQHPIPFLQVRSP